MFLVVAQVSEETQFCPQCGSNVILGLPRTWASQVMLPPSGIPSGLQRPDNKRENNPDFYLVLLLIPLKCLL